MTQELLIKRKNLIQDSFKLKKTQYTPIYGNVMSWMVLDQGCRVDEAAFDFETHKKIFKGFVEKFNFDWYCDYGTYTIFPAVKEMGALFAHFNDDGTQYSIADHHCMEENEYEEFTDNIAKFRWEKALKRICGEKITYRQFYNAMQKFMGFGAYCEEMKEYLLNTAGCPTVTDNYFGSPLEDFVNYYRGLNGISIDMRRHKDKLKAALDKIAEKTIPAAIAGLDYTGEYDVQSLDTTIIAHMFMNNKQFAELYWPYLKKVIDAVRDKNKLMSIYLEGKALTITDFLRDIPAGMMNITFEMDDPFELRAKLPNLCMTGGLKNTTLTHGTKQEVIDEAKALIDGMGNGYCLSTVKCLAYKNDANADNLIAVNDFVRNYAH